ncbi:hypothetical protein BT96DRAFT_945266 [Gymnopus androsaceus JB14]|uniref:Uncharacterized protein n=1 Tax=Gymnopus androsaceus JB14 TaxID=1447944 RepID=A0A6A4H039_9AGAR|nr:hypothetical protein BT96DRAFT_945266 [Gymnopus androsaceus JB14]
MIGEVAWVLCRLITESSLRFHEVTGLGKKLTCGWHYNFFLFLNLNVLGTSSNSTSSNSDAPKTPVAAPLPTTVVSQLNSNVIIQQLCYIFATLSERTILSYQLEVRFDELTSLLQLLTKLPVPRARHQAYRYNGGDEDHIVKLEVAIMNLDEDCLLPVGLKVDGGSVEEESSEGGVFLHNILFCYLL